MRRLLLWNIKDKKVLERKKNIISILTGEDRIEYRNVFVVHTQNLSAPKAHITYFFHTR